MERLAAEYPAPTNCARSDIHRYAAFGRAYLASAEDRFEDAISILNGLLYEFESVGNRHLAFRVQTHAATVRFRAKQVAEAGAGRIACSNSRFGRHSSIEAARSLPHPRLRIPLRPPPSRGWVSSCSPQTLSSRHTEGRLSDVVARRSRRARIAGRQNQSHHPRRRGRRGHASARRVQRGRA